MGSEVSSEEDNGYQNGDVKKDDDLRENEADESDKDGKTIQDVGVTHKNGDLRSRKAGKATGRSKAELKRAILKGRSPSKKEQEKTSSSKIGDAWSKVEKKLPRWLKRVLVLLFIVALGFGTRLFSLTLPSHIWLVQIFISILILLFIE